MSSNDRSTCIPAELPKNRNAFAKTYVTAPGRYTSFQSAIPIHTINAETHEWQQINAQFTPVEKPTEESPIKEPLFISKTSSFTMTCGAGSRAPFIAMEDQQRHLLSRGIEGAQNVKPEIPEDVVGNQLLAENKDDLATTAFLTAMFRAQGSVRYKDILPGITLELHTDSQVAYTLSFADRSAAHEIVFSLDAHGMKVTQNKETGQILFGDVKESVFTIYPASLYDAAGNDGEAKTVLDSNGDTYRIVYIPDPAFMDTAVYPVTLDPVIRIRDSGASVEDTYINSLYTSSHYHTNARINVGNSNGTQIGFLRFNSLPVLASSHFMTKARMVLCSVSKPSSSLAFYARSITDTLHLAYSDITAAQGLFPTP